MLGLGPSGGSSILPFPTMKEETKKINHPHFYRHDKCTFEELMN